MKMNINFVNFCNQTIGGLNKLQGRIEDLKENYTQSSEEHYILDELEEIISREFCATDVGFSILAAHLEDVANHAIEVDDKEVIRSLKCMGILSEEAKEQTNAE